MEDKDFIELFAALAQEHRLAVFRLLMRQGPSGLPAGEISRRLGVPPSTLSAHLAQLSQAGLIRATRNRQQILYAADIEGTRRLIDYLTEDCCQGRPDVCGYAEPLACSPNKEPADER